MRRIHGFAAALILSSAMILSAIPAQARYGDDVLVRGEITGVDGKMVVLALKKRLVIVPRTTILKRYSVRVGEKVVARLPLKMVKVTGNTTNNKKKRK